MNRTCRSTVLAILCLAMSAMLAWADTIILRDGRSYSGWLTSAADGAITFADQQGVKYQFPLRDVQSLVFTSSVDTVTLRSGKVYSGHFTGSNPLSFEDWQGVKYQFPLSDVESLVLSSSRSGSEAPSLPADARIIPTGSEISVRTNERIDSSQSFPGKTYSAEISHDVLDAAGAVVIPRGSPAELMIRTISPGGAVHTPELTLDLYSVTINGTKHQVVSSDVEEKNPKGFGANRRTAEFLGGGAALGALVGGLFGGGKGAGIGALAGGGGGFATEVLTRGKEVRVPAETVLRFRLERRLVLRPVSQSGPR